MKIISIIFFFTLAFNSKAQKDSLDSEKYRVVIGVSVSLNYSNSTSIAFHSSVNELIREEASGNEEWRLGQSLNIYGEFSFSEKYKLNVGIYVSSEGNRTKEMTFNYYEFYGASADTSRPLDEEIQVNFKNHFNYIGLSLGLKSIYGSNKIRFMHSFGLIPKFLISASSEGIVGSSPFTISYKRFNMDAYLAMGVSIQSKKSRIIEISPVFRCSFYQIEALPSIVRLWNVGLQIGLAI